MSAATHDGSLLAVSIHDIAPASADATRRWLADLDERGIPATLLLIPGPWRGAPLSSAPDLVSDLLDAEARGHELALHGFHHVAERSAAGPAWRRATARVMARGAAEFANLGHAEAARRLADGLAELAALGIRPVGFHPPGWLASPEAVRALRRSGIIYYSTHLTIHELVGDERRVPMPALSHRPGGFGESLGAALMKHAASRFARGGHGFRIALHPDDLTRPGLREATLTAIDTALELGARPVTYAAALAAARVADGAGVAGATAGV